jgi:Domain of unknown function (DUF4397)
MRMNKRHLLGLVAALPLAWLTACGGGDDGNDASVRLVNASPGYASLDLYVEDTKEVSDVAFGAGSEYTGVASGSDVSNVLTAAGSTTELLDQSRTLGSGKKYTLVAYGWEGALKSVIMTDDEDAADSNKTKVSVLNSAIDAGELDVYLTGTDETLESSTPIASGVDAGSQSGFSSVTSGTYRLRVTGTGDPTDLRLDIPSVTLSSTQVLTLIMTPGQGGVLVHAIGAVQSGDVTPYLNTQARVRMVAAVANSGVVSVSAGGTSLGTDVRSATIRDYLLVDAGSLTVHTTVNGTALTDTVATVAAGADVTLLVTGNTAADATVNVIADDDRLPTVSSKYKLRLVHAAPSLASENLSLTVDAGAVVSDLPFGEASAFDDLVAATSATIDISTPTRGSIYTLTEQNLLSNGLYTVFMFDFLDGAGNVVPRGVLRKDR